MTQRYYRLVFDGFLAGTKEIKYRVEPCDARTWAEGCNNPNRVLWQEWVGGQLVSTVFLGLDHSFGTGRPLIFETMVFGGKLDQHMERYSTWAEAKIGHLKTMRKVIEATSPWRIAFSGFLQWRHPLLRRMRTRWALWRVRYYGWKVKTLTYVQRLIDHTSK